MRKVGYLLVLAFLIHSVSNCSNKESETKLLVLHENREETHQIINKVSRENLVETIRNLQGFRTRFTHEKQLVVARYLFNRLKEQEVDVRSHDYLLKNKIYKNIEVRIPGTKNPNKYFVVGGHYDSKSEISNQLAPGADDNASGVAALVELARILKDHAMANTVRITFFSNEERGQHGSSNYVKYIESIEDEFLGAIIVDMIAYSGKNEDLDVATLPKFKWMALATKEIGEMYGLIPMDVKIDKHCF